MTLSWREKWRYIISKCRGRNGCFTVQKYDSFHWTLLKAYVAVYSRGRTICKSLEYPVDVYSPLWKQTWLCEVFWCWKANLQTCCVVMPLELTGRIKHSDLQICDQGQLFQICSRFFATTIWRACTLCELPVRLPVSRCHECMWPISRSCAEQWGLLSSLWWRSLPILILF
jgi:hypothetical protein